MTTSALVAVGVLASAGAAQAQGKPTLTLGGWFEGIFGVVSDDGRSRAVDSNAGKDGNLANPTHVAADVMIDSEIFFNGNVTLDNGIRIRTRVELEAQSGNSTDQIDESFMRISGKFGEVRVGSEDNAAHLMVTPLQGSWSTNVGQNTNFDVADWIEQPAGIRVSNVNRLDLGDADSEKITYFTPRISGFQLGATYMPAMNSNGIEIEGNDSAPSPRQGVFHEGYAVGATYHTKFNNVGVALGAGYAEANPGLPDQSRPAGFNAGLVVDVGGFRASVGFDHEFNQTQNTVANDGNNHEINVGVRYKQGRNNFSVGYAHAEDEHSRAIPGNDKLDQLMASYRRDLGPGVQYRLNLMWADWQQEDAPGTVDKSLNDNSGYAATTSVRIAF